MNTTGVAAGVLSVVLGVLVCFFGYRLLRGTLAVAGFTVGALLGAALASSVLHSSGVFVVVVAVVAGILGGVLAAVLYKAGVFLLGAVGTALLVGVVIVSTGGMPKTLILILFGIAGGLLTLLFQRLLVCILTAFTGAGGVALGIFQLCGWYAGDISYQALTQLRSAIKHLDWMVVLWGVLAIAGTVVQLRQHYKRKR